MAADVGRWGYDRARDRWMGHVGPVGVLGSGWVGFELDELELGGRAAMALDDPEQWWWELIGRAEMERLAASEGPLDNRLGADPRALAPAEPGSAPPDDVRPGAAGAAGPAAP